MLRHHIDLARVLECALVIMNLAIDRRKTALTLIHEPHQSDMVSELCSDLSVRIQELLEHLRNLSDDPLYK